MSQPINTQRGGAIGVRRRVLTAFVLVVVVFLAVFLVAEPLLSDDLTDPESWIERGVWWVALASIALLASDVVLPVPSSAVMIANGVAFGFVGGLAVSLVGSVIGSVLGLLVGRAAGRSVGRWRKHLSPDDVEAVLGPWRTTAVIASRPVPLVAEGVAVLVGTTPYAVRRMAAASAVGILPFAALYAWAGSSARESASTVLVVGALVASALLGLGVLFVSRTRA